MPIGSGLINGLRSVSFAHAFSIFSKQITQSTQTKIIITIKLIKNYIERSKPIPTPNLTRQETLEETFNKYQAQVEKLGGKIQFNEGNNVTIINNNNNNNNNNNQQLEQSLPGGGI